jgi:two-component system nitrogen regulation sensor histidine kinase GlnL
MARRLASFFNVRGAAAVAKEPPPAPAFDANLLLSALPRPVFTLDGEGRIAYVNQAAEQFLAASAAHLVGQRLDTLVRPDSPIFALVDQAREHAGTVAEHGVTLANPRIGQRAVSIEAAALPEMAGMVVVMLQESSIADKIDRQLTHRSAARSVTGMAALLAHEVKNPLSGIRGAAQLL